MTGATPKELTLNSSFLAKIDNPYQKSSLPAILSKEKLVVNEYNDA